MTTPRPTTMRSNASPARLERKSAMAITTEMIEPIVGSRPIIASVPSPVPAMLPMLKMSPPRRISPARAHPRPGRRRLASSWARSPETPRTRQTFIWIAMSTRIETTIAKAKAAPSSMVKVVVWVMNPGPMAEVAMRNIAPRMALRRPASLSPEAGVSSAVEVVGGSAGWCDMHSPDSEERVRVTVSVVNPVGGSPHTVTASLK